MKTILYALAIATLCSTTAGKAAIYYVATNGNNTNVGTSKSLAWRTPGYGSRRLMPGDTLVICAGDYVLSQFDVDDLKPRSGLTNAWITIRGETGAVLKGRNDLFAGIILDGKSNLRLENIELTHDSAAVRGGGLRLSSFDRSGPRAGGSAL